MIFKPAADRKVREPTNRLHIPAEGIEVADDSPNLSYWLRRLRSGDVVLVEDAPAAAPAPAKKGD